MPEYKVTIRGHMWCGASTYHSYKYQNIDDSQAVKNLREYSGIIIAGNFRSIEEFILERWDEDNWVIIRDWQPFVSYSVT